MMTLLEIQQLTPKICRFHGYSDNVCKLMTI